MREALEASHRLSINEFELLLALSTSPDRRLAMSELAERAFLKQSGLSRLVDRLARRGLVDRAPAEGDRRTRCVTATGKGYALWRDASRGHRERVRASFLDHLDDAELQQLGDLWERLALIGDWAGPSVGLLAAEPRRPGL